MAVCTGQLAAIQWLHNNGAELAGNMWQQGKCWPHVHTLRWAIEETDIVWGIDPAPNTCWWLYGEVDCEAWKWAHDNGCPCDCGDSSLLQYCTL
jgi:hypothetical protein